MCKHGNTIPMKLTVPGHLSHSGKPYQKLVGIDRCIAPLVRALNDAGITTVASCCGHENRPGNIALVDGRELIIVPSYEVGREIDKMFPDIHGE